MEVSSQLYRMERIPSTHWTGGWMYPRAGLDTVVKRKIPAPGIKSRNHIQLKIDAEVEDMSQE
jgi:hypothetical protein